MNINEKYMEHKAGTIFVRTSGDYSDYQIVNHYKVLKDYSSEAEYRKYVDREGLKIEFYPFKVFPPNKYSPNGSTSYACVTYYCPSLNKFYLYLESEGFIEEVEVKEEHENYFYFADIEDKRKNMPKVTNKYALTIDEAFK